MRIRNFDDVDIIAILVLLGGFTLMAMKIDGTVGAIMTTVVGFYFGKKFNGKT